MKSKLLNGGRQKTWAVVFETGDEVMAGLQRFAQEHQVHAGQFSAIGAFSDVLLGFFNLEKKDYKRIPLAEQVEVLSLLGDITVHRGQPQIHAHVVVGRSDGTAHGGHLIEAHVRPTLEVVVTESPEYLRRRKDQETGLPLIELEGEQK